MTLLCPRHVERQLGEAEPSAEGKAADRPVPSLYNMHTFSCENYLQTSAGSGRSFPGMLLSQSLISLTFC